MEIKYEYTTTVCTTTCKNHPEELGYKVKIGSFTCQRCPYFRGIDKDNQIVECEYWSVEECLEGNKGVIK